MYFQLLFILSIASCLQCTLLRGSYQEKLHDDYLREIKKLTLNSTDLKTNFLCMEKQRVDKCIDTSFIEQLEGYTNYGYVPKNASGLPFPTSGVTIGIGVDLKETTRPYFEKIGVPETIIDKIAPYFGLHGQAAQDYLDKHPLVLTDKETMQLSDAVLHDHYLYVQRGYNSAIRKLGGNLKCFGFGLTDAQRTVISSVLYQYGSPSRIPRFWNFVTTQDWKSAIYELRHFHDAFPTRRNKEADKLEHDPGTNSCKT